MPARVRMRWTAYAGISTTMAGFVVLKALAQRPNFYSAAVYLSQSSANLMIMTNFVFVTACTFLFGLQKLLYGQLRPIEIEQLYEKAWFAVTETCLAMTIFRGEVGAWFLVMFFSLLAGKVWGWIGEGRVEILEQQPPRNPRLFHTRLALSLTLGVAFTGSMLQYTITQVMRQAKPDMMVMFGFEFTILTIISFSTACRYAITLVEIFTVREQKKSRGEEMRKERMEAAKRDLEDAERQAAQPAEQQADTQLTAISVDDAKLALRRAEQPVDENEIEVEGWENKGRWVFYLDLATDFLKLVTYLSFFFILLIFYGLPIHIMRDVFLTTRSFFKRISDFMKYRTATRNMRERYPDATADEIGREDVCIICREEMRPYQAPAPGQPPPNPAVERMRPKKLPCGHVLHFSCLRSWLERQQVCPTCRRDVEPTAAVAAAAAAAQPGAPGQAAQHPPGERQGGPRVYQFGPLRIGVGAARGNNMFEDLQQQLVDGRAAPAGQANANGPQQYGFGFRWEGRQRHRRRHREQGTVREQLDAVQQQIQQEHQTMAQNLREYAVLRAMQTELDRVRAMRDTTGVPPVNGGVQPGPVPASQPPQVLHAQSGTQVIPAGSDQLPEGLTLPEGWAMMPLHRSGPNGVPTPGQQAMAPPANRAQPAPVPATDHVRAMFSNMPGQPTNSVPPVDEQNASASRELPRADGLPSTAATADVGTSSDPAPSTNGEPSTVTVATPHTNGLDHAANLAAEPATSSSTTQALPSWGSSASAEKESDQSSKGKERAEPSDEASQPAEDSNSKQPRVEDLVEDPD